MLAGQGVVAGLSLRKLSLWAALGTLGLAAFPHIVDAEIRDAVLSEGGWIELPTELAWVFAAIAALVRRRPPNLPLISYATVFVIFAERESGALAGLAGGGARFLRAAYYQSDAPLLERGAVALVLGVCVLLLIVAIVAGLRELIRPAEFTRAELQCLTFAVALLAISQIAEVGHDALLLSDRLHAAIADSLLAIEEGLELLAPLLVAATLLRPKRS